MQVFAAMQRALDDGQFDPPASPTAAQSTVHGAVGEEDSYTLRFGFSLKLVTLSGNNMERLFEALVKLPSQVIYEEPEHQVDDE